MTPEPFRSVPTVANPPVIQESTQEPDTVRKYAVRYQMTPGATQTHGDGPHDDLNAAVFERNTLFHTNDRVGRVWIDVVSGWQILRRWGAVMKREWCLQ